VARKSGETRQKPKVEQDRGKSVGEEYGTPRGKCAAKRETNNMENGGAMRAPKRKQFPMHSNTLSKISSHTIELRNK